MKKVVILTIIAASLVSGLTYFYHVRNTPTVEYKPLDCPRVLKEAKPIESICSKDESKELPDSEKITSEHDSIRYAKKYIIESETRNIRYGIAQNKYVAPKLFLKKRNKKEDIEKQARIVFKYLPHIKTTPESINLVVETIISESNGGRLIDVGSGDLGICQIRIPTVKSLLKYCDYKHPDVKKAIMSFYNKKLSMKDNLKYNTKFSIAVCISVYWHKMGGNFYEHIKTLTERAIAWKSVYNTKYGLGTVNKYIERVKGYDV